MVTKAETKQDIAQPKYKCLNPDCSIEYFRNDDSLIYDTVNGGFYVICPKCGWTKYERVSND